MIKIQNALKIYKDILEGKVNKFPAGVWVNKNSKEISRKLVIWLIEEHLQLTDTQIKNQISYNFFAKYKLRTMLYKIYNNSPYAMLNDIYPGRFKPWELRHASVMLWQDPKNRIAATKWLIEDKLKFTDDVLKDELSTKLFKDNGLNGMLSQVYNHSPFKAIDEAYPNKFHRYDFRNYRIYNK